MSHEGFIDGTPVLEPGRLGANQMPVSEPPATGRIHGAGQVTFPSLAERRALNELLRTILERQRNEFTITE